MDVTRLCSSLPLWKRPSSLVGKRWPALFLLGGALLHPVLSLASEPDSGKAELIGTATTTAHESTPPPRREDASVALDRQMAELLTAMTLGDTETATHLALAITVRYPDFALAQLLLGELNALAALDPLQVDSQQAWSPRLLDLLLEARRRLELAAGRKPPEALVPAAIIQAGRQSDEILLVDIAQSTLYRYRNTDGTLKLRHTHYVSSGRGGAGKQLEGDLKTPIGLYRITESLVDAELPALYGHGALVLDYPNLLDRRRGKTGHGIWLHGNPEGQTSRAPYSSEGCVTMTNEHVAVLMNELPLTRTEVVLSESVSWRTRAEAEKIRAEWLQRLARWQRAWLDDDGIVLDALYHPSSRPDVRDRAAMTASVAALQPSSVSILVSPSEPGDESASQTVKMSLPLDPRNPTLETILWWQLDTHDRWRIIAEERANPAL